MNQSIKIYIAPFKDPYPEALQTQAKRKRTVFKSWLNWKQAPFGRCFWSEGRPARLLDQPLKRNASALPQSRRTGTLNQHG